MTLIRTIVSFVRIKQEVTFRSTELHSMKLVLCINIYMAVRIVHMDSTIAITVWHTKYYCKF